MSETLPSGPFGMYPHAFAAWHTKGCGINVAELDERIPTAPEMAPQCFSIVWKGCGNIAERAEGLPKRWR